MPTNTCDLSSMSLTFDIKSMFVLTWAPAMVPQDVCIYCMCVCMCVCVCVCERERVGHIYIKSAGISGCQIFWIWWHMGISCQAVHFITLIFWPLYHFDLSEFEVDFILQNVRFQLLFLSQYLESGKCANFNWQLHFVVLNLIMMLHSVYSETGIPAHVLPTTFHMSLYACVD